MPPTLLERAPVGADADSAYTDFVEWATDRGISLYPAQDEAVIELVSGVNVILSTPTGTGKSLVAVGVEWAAEGFETLGRAYETALLATMLGLGIQIVFGAFFLALLVMPLRRETA